MTVKCRILIRLCTHEEHSIPCPYRWDMESLLWVFWWKIMLLQKGLSVHIFWQFLLFFPRDLRPTNILLGEHGHVLLTYFSQWRGVDRPISFSAQEGFYTAPGKISFLWPSARLRLLQCISNGVTVVLSLAISDQYAVHLLTHSGRDKLVAIFCRRFLHMHFFLNENFWISNEISLKYVP